MITTGASETGTNLHIKIPDGEPSRVTNEFRDPDSDAPPGSCSRFYYTLRNFISYARELIILRVLQWDFRACLVIRQT